MVDRQPCSIAISHEPSAMAVFFYLRCLLTSLVISNMLTVALPPNTAFKLSSALIMRLFFLSCRPFFLMYAQSFLVTSVRGIAFDPTTSASFSLGWTGFMNAAFGFRFAAAFFAISSPCEDVPWDVVISMRSIMPTPARLYHCFQRRNTKKSYSSEGKMTFPEGKTAFSEESGVVGDPSSRSIRQRIPQGVRQR